jgi:hypothetical protein
MSNLQPLPEHVISEDGAKKLLERYLSLFKRSISDGWRAWESLGKKAPDLRAPLSKQCRARFIYDHIVEAAKAHFAADQRVTIIEKCGLLTLRVDNKNGTAILRFKKVDDKMRARNYPTQQQLRFSLQLQLPGWPTATRLIAGYQLDLLETQIKDVVITCPVGNKVEWFFSIADAEEIGGTVTLPVTPVIPAAPVVTARGVRKTKNEDDPNS